MTINFYSIIHHLNGGVGHELPYQKSLQNIVNNLGWKFIALTSVDDNFTDLPEDWLYTKISHGIIEMPRENIKSCLFSIHSYKFVTHTFNLAYKFKCFFTNKFNGDVQSVIFFESFNPLQLCALLVSLLFVKHNRLTLILLMRGSKNWGGKKHRLMSYSFSYSFKILILAFRKLAKDVHVVISTDSNLLQKTLEPFYNCNVNVFPIPHTNCLETTPKHNSNESNLLKIWWPGTPRLDKGSEEIKRIIETLSIDSSVLLYYSQTKLITTQCKDNVVLLPETLDSFDYEKMMHLADIIILPYDRDIYNESTSGIFTEAIFANKITLVTDGTWMASELRRYDLDELIITWEDFEINSFLIEIDIGSVRSKVNHMSDSYKSFHSSSNFMAVLNDTVLVDMAHN